MAVAAFTAGGKTLYLIADQFGNSIRAYDPATCEVNTFAGVSAPSRPIGSDGPITGAGTVFHPRGILVDHTHPYCIYVAEAHAIRVIKDGHITTLIGNGTAEFADGTCSAARVSCPTGMVLSANGEILYFADRGNNRLRTLRRSTAITQTIAGDGFPKSVNGIGLAASIDQPAGICWDRRPTVKPYTQLLIACCNNVRVCNIETRTCHRTASSLRSHPTY